MVNFNNYSARNQCSVHFGRQNINNRYLQRAYMRAYGGGCCHGGSSIFPDYGAQQTSINYNYSTSDSYTKGYVVGSLFKSLPDIISGCKNIFHSIFG